MPENSAMKAAAKALFVDAGYDHNAPPAVVADVWNRLGARYERSARAALLAFLSSEECVEEVAREIWAAVSQEKEYAYRVWGGGPGARGDLAATYTYKRARAAIAALKQIVERGE